MHSGQVNLALGMALAHAYRGLPGALLVFVEVVYIILNRGNQRVPHLRRGGDLLFKMLCPVDLGRVCSLLLADAAARSCSMFTSISSIHFIWFSADRDGNEEAPAAPFRMNDPSFRISMPSVRWIRWETAALPLNRHVHTPSINEHNKTYPSR